MLTDEGTLLLVKFIVTGAWTMLRNDISVHIRDIIWFGVRVVENTRPLLTIDGQSQERRLADLKVEDKHTVGGNHKEERSLPWPAAAQFSTSPQRNVVRFVVRFGYLVIL